MSKFKPEVGDVWKSKESGTVFVLTRKDDYFKDWFTQWLVMEEREK